MRGSRRDRPDTSCFACIKVSSDDAKNESFVLLSVCYSDSMGTTLIQAKLPSELTERARVFVDDGWATNFDELLGEALLRYLESHAGDLTEKYVMDDVRWGLHGRD
jgi:hypothetical protein